MELYHNQAGILVHIKVTVNMVSSKVDGPPILAQNSTLPLFRPLDSQSVMQSNLRGPLVRIFPTGEIRKNFLPEKIQVSLSTNF